MLEQLGETIRTYRNRLGFTQNDLASALLVSPQAVSKWERGENAPDIALLPALAELLGTSTDTLLGRNRQPRRTVNATVVTLDMEGFGPLARELPPDELAVALNTFFYPVSEAVMAQDGVPLQYVGDEVSAVFTGEDQALRAFRAVFGALKASPRPLRAAVASGSVWLGTLGHPLHGATACLGEPLNLASWAHTWLNGHPEARVAGTASAVEAAREHLQLGASETVTSWGSPQPYELFLVLALT